MRSHAPGVFATAVVLLASPSDPARAADKLLFTSLATPCRLVDTRGHGGPIASSSSRAFNVVGANLNTPDQGGTAGGCGIPDFSNGSAQTQAVLFNFVAVGPAGAGDLQAWPTDQARPTNPPAAVLNYVPPSTGFYAIANGIVIPVRQDTAGGDVSILADGGATDVVIDVTGYFTKAEPRKYYLTTTPQNGAAADTACAAGYHFASLWEIFDTTQLRYNTTLGYTSADSGQGPPTDVDGWVRTGYASDGSATIGRANCLMWGTANGGSSGTFVALSQFWDLAAQRVSPWTGITGTCDFPRRSWCVED
jgi:hypothetical protein